MKANEAEAFGCANKPAAVHNSAAAWASALHKHFLALHK